MTNFLPKDYTVPTPPSNYMRFQKGTNRFRILSEAITGWEYWDLNNKPVRSSEPFEFMPEDIKMNKDGSVSDIKHFWAFVIWDYEDNKVKILEITQATIQRSLKTAIDLRKGNASNNDIVVERSGDGFDTEYTVSFLDPSPIPPEAEKAYLDRKIDLTALFTGEDPFNSKTPTPKNKASLNKLEPEPESVDDLPF